MALYHLKVTGEFDAAVHEWEEKPTASKMWSNIKTFISMEYAKENKQNAESMEKLIATLTEAHTQQIENLVRSTTEAMKEIMLLLKENKNFNINVTNEEKIKKRQENQKKYSDAPICKHCGKKHQLKAEDECWSLEKNKVSCPPTWKPNKSN
jgi:hypothetical protein